MNGHVNANNSDNENDSDIATIAAGTNGIQQPRIPIDSTQFHTIRSN